MASSASAPILLMVSGQVKHCIFPEFDDLWCKYCFVYGKDWELVAGSDAGLTQIAKCSQDDREIIVWNFPVDATFQSTNPYGWPQICLTIYGQDFLGRDVVRGYGACHIPTIPGPHSLDVPLFVPEPSSTFQRFIGWILGRRSEFHDEKMVTQNEGREVATVRTQGHAFVDLNLIFKDTKSHNYEFIAIH